MKKHLVRALQIIGVIVIVLIVIYSGIAVILYSSSGRFPVRKTTYPPVRVKHLIWPTVGYPALANPGSSIEVEFDFNRAPGGGRKQVEGTYGWDAVMKPAREALRGLTYRLKAIRAWKDISSRWPAGTGRGGPYIVWHTEFQVPGDVVPELYDLTVEAVAGGKRLSDRQPHAVSVSKKTGNDFRYVTMADIHVHRRNISGVFAQQTNKGITPEGRPVFFERAIEQVNLIRPDFVILLGDFVRAQHAPGDYQVEFANFYDALLDFEVPVFTIPGNHDQYINEVDGARVWESALGPLFYSFDVGDCHFTAANTTEWPVSDRIVMEKLGLFVYPRKWQGQVLHARKENDVKTFGGQLAWLRDDLASHQRSKLRVMLMHHDPYTPGGEGISWKNERYAGVYTLGGGGRGSAALEQLVAQYSVALVHSGHLHDDNMGRVAWPGGGGETVYANQTCVYFDEGGVQEKYPGYRLVEVRGGKPENLTYLDGKSSIPFYDGSVPGGETNLDRLSRSALSAEEFTAAGREAGAGEAVPGSVARTGWLVKSYLGVPMELRGLVMDSAGTRTGYSSSGGEIYQTVQVPGSSRVLMYVSVTMGKGIPGASAIRPGTPARSEVTVQPSVTGTRRAAVAVP